MRSWSATVADGCSLLRTSKRKDICICRRVATANDPHNELLLSHRRRPGDWVALRGVSGDAVELAGLHHVEDEIRSVVVNSIAEDLLIWKDV